MNWIKLNEGVSGLANLSASESPLMVTLREETDRCELELKYLTGDGGHRIWHSEVDSSSVEFARHPFRVITVITQGSPCPQDVKVYNRAIDAFLAAEAPDPGQRRTWTLVMKDVLHKLLDENPKKLAVG